MELVDRSTTGPGQENGHSAELLTEQEIRVVRMISTGAGYPAVAAALAVSESTLKRQLNDIQTKLGVQNKIQMVAYLARRGLL